MGLTMRRLCDVRWMRVISFSALLMFGKLTHAAEPETVSWYSRGQKETWEVNNSKVTFKTYDKVSATNFRNKSVAEKISILNMHGYNLLMADITQQEIINEELSYQLSEYKPVYALKYKHASGLLPDRDIYIDNQLLVKFKQPFVSQTALEQFMAQYNLTLAHQPAENLSQYGHYTYVFNVTENSTVTHPAKLAGKIYQDNKSIIAEARPNMLNMYEINNNAVSSAAWHLANQGQSIFCSSVNAQQAANTGIVSVWNAGYKGQHIKVGIIDVHGFDYNHPDMQGQFHNGWDFIKNQEINQNNFAATSQTQSHGMAVAGIIAAKSGGGATGVAPEAKIVPFLVDLSDVSIIRALQKAMQPGFDVDVLNCSFSGTGNNPLIEDEIKNLTSFGRVRFGEAKGVVVVGSAGNENLNDEQITTYPGGYAEVISVTATTPEDKKKEINDKWNLTNAWAPNYGKKLHIGAPGVCIPTTDFSGNIGYSSSNYISFSRTSSAAPVVAGVVALLLSKNQELTFQEIHDKLAESADKVGGYNYNYDTEKPGHSKEMGFGRVNALKAIEETAVSVKEVTNNTAEYKLAVENPVGGTLTINYDFSNLKEDVVLEIYNPEGKLVNVSKLFRHEELITIDVYDLSPGMYYSKFYNKEDDLVQTVKFIKLW